MKKTNKPVASVTANLATTLICGLTGLCASNAIAQSSSPMTVNVGSASFTLYGNIDSYMSHQTVSGGKSFTSLEEGAFLRSRLGVRGEKDLGEGLTAKFTLETGIKSNSGEQAQSDRLFDRQAWIGVAGNFGEVRLGRQNTVVFAPTAMYQDFTYRSLGSLANSFSFPARLDDDIAYISPRIKGFKAEAHYSFADDDGKPDTSGTGPAKDENKNIGIKQLGLDYENGPFRAGFAGLIADTPRNFTNKRDAYFYNLYANYNYGKGMIYLAQTESNNRAGQVVTGEKMGTVNFPLFPLGGQYDVATRQKNYSISTVSADYNVTSTVRVGALYSAIKDKTNGTDEATGYAVGAYWKALKDTTLYLILAGIDNKTAGNYQFDGSAPLRKKFDSPDVMGKSLQSINTGFVYQF